jgi:hypothetical protein
LAAVENLENRSRLAMISEIDEQSDRPVTAFSVAASRILGRAAALEDHLHCLVTGDSKTAYVAAFGVLAAAVVATSALLFLAGAAPQRDDPWDTMMILDGGWRLINGIKPHHDYFDHLGFTSHLPILLGMIIAGGRSQALAYGPAVLLPVIALWTWGIAQRRFPAFPALWIALLTGGLVVGTFPLGDLANWRLPSYQMQYNRFQWSLLCLLTISLFAAPRQTLSRRAALVEGASTGLLTGLLLLGKLNYSVAALLVLGGSGLGGWVVRNRTSYWLAASLVCFAANGAFFFCVHGDFASTWRDLSIIYGVQRSSERLGDLVRVLSRSWPELGAFCFVVFIHLRRIFAEDQTAARIRARLIAITAAAFLLGVGLLATIGNAQGYDIPMWALASVILAESLGKEERENVRQGERETRDFSSSHALTFSRSSSAPLRALLGYAAAGIAVLGFAVTDLGSVAYVFAWKQARIGQMPADSKFEAAPLSDLCCPPDTYEPREIEAIRTGIVARTAKKLSPFEYAIYLNKGIDLLRSRIDEKARVFTLDWSNPFPFAMHTPAPLGTPLFWHEHRLLDDAHHPPVEVIMQEVTHVMVPKRPIFGTGAPFMHRVCDGYLKEHFSQAAENDMWVLYVRKAAEKLPAMAR